MKTLIKHVLFLDGNRGDILIQDDLIMAIESHIEEVDAQIIDLKHKAYVSAGWIDMHTHCYDGFTLYASTPDEIGYKHGVTTVVDAGTTGGDHIHDFKDRIKDVKTSVYAFINASKIGIQSQDELSDLNNLDEGLLLERIQELPEFILGVKVRMSKSVIGENGIEPLTRAKAMAKKAKLPLMVHIGSNPPELDDILVHLEAGDIVTHVYNGKKNGIIRDGKPAEFVREARQRGVLFDIGHGSESFSFNTAKIALASGFAMDSISTDIYDRNMIHGPVYDLATTMSKFLALGFDKLAVVDLVTKQPAKILGLNNVGELKVNQQADLTFFKFAPLSHALVDSHGEQVELDEGFKPVGVMVKGKYYDIES